MKEEKEKELEIGKVILDGFTVHWEYCKEDNSVFIKLTDQDDKLIHGMLHTKSK